MDFPGSLFDIGADAGLTTLGKGSPFGEMVMNAGVTLNTINLGSNVVVYVPVVVPFAVTLYGALWNNGATSSGNVDVGLMDSDGNRLINTGSTAQGTISVATIVTFGTPKAIPAGLYYIAFTQDNATGLVSRASASIAANSRACGCQQETTGSFGIPALWTPAAFPVSIPFAALATASVF